MFVEGIISTVEVGRCPKEICRFSIIFIKFPVAFFTKLYKIILKFTHRHNRPGLAEVTLSRNNSSGGFTKAPSRATLQNHSKVNTAPAEKTETFRQQNSMGDSTEIQTPTLSQKPLKHPSGEDLFNKWCQNPGYHIKMKGCPDP